MIDDFKGDPVALGTSCQPILSGTRLVITCIQDPGAEFFRLELPPLSERAATDILEYGISGKPGKEIVVVVSTRVGFHPLTLAVIRDTVREAEVPWEEIVRDLHNIPQYEGPNHETIVQRILLNHSQGIADELCVLRWLDVVAIDSKVALAVLGPSGIGKVLDDQSSVGTLKECVECTT